MTELFHTDELSLLRCPTMGIMLLLGHLFALAYCVLILNNKRITILTLFILVSLLFGYSIHIKVTIVHHLRITYKHRLTTLFLFKMRKPWSWDFGLLVERTTLCLVELFLCFDWVYLGFA